MTCIVGMVRDNKVYIGGDSAGVSGLNIRVRNDKKVFKNKNMIFGCTSSFRMINLLRYKLVIPKQKSNMTDYEYLCTDFIDEVIKCFKDNGFSNINNNEESGGTFLIGYKSNLYCIESDYQVAMVKDSYDSCGSGSNYALGSMKTLYNWDSFEDCEPEVYITEALSAAEYFSCGVYKPFNIVSL